MTQSMDETDCRTLLLRELELRQQRNSHYSMRAFARDLNVQASELSRLLSRKRRMTIKSAVALLKGLEWNDEQKYYFLDLAIEEMRQHALADLSSQTASSAQVMKKAPKAEPETRAIDHEAD